MNILNFALGGLAGGLSGSPLASITGAPIALMLAQKPAGAGNGAAPVPARDGQISDLPEISSMVNLLQQIAGSQTPSSPTSASQATDASQAPLLNLPPLPPMPQPQKPAAVPTDDHGQSNIVFSDAAADGSFIS